MAKSPANESLIGRSGSQKRHHGSDPMENILTGRLADLPVVPSNTIKIYISSTREDFELERRLLWDQILPELHREFVPLGLDIIFVDSHQTSLPDHTYDRHKFSQHLREITLCHKVSPGIFFLSLLGNKRGPIPLPAHLSQAEYSHLREAIMEAKKDVNLLDEWFLKDDNANPPVYTQRSLTSKFDNYNSTNVRLSAQQKKQAKEWSKIFSSLQESLQYAAAVCYKNGKINQENSHHQQKYFMSGVEQEIQQALETSTSGCLIISRHFVGIKSSEEGSDKYLDLKRSGGVDHTAQQRLKVLQDVLSSKLEQQCKHNLMVAWKAPGLLPAKFHQHAEYIENFHATVLDQLSQMIHRSISLTTGTQDTADKFQQLQKEALIHLLYCKKHAPSKLRGFEDLLLRVKDIIIQGCKEEHQATVFYGPDGCGKTALLSRAAYVALETLGRDVVLIVRYIGLSPASKTVKTFLKSICMQLAYIIKSEDVDLHTMDLAKLVPIYLGLLKKVSKVTRHVVLIIDGIDNFNESSNDNQNLDWLTTTLPPCVHVFASVSNTQQNSRTMNILKGYGVQALIPITKLETLHVRTIIKDYAAKYHRDLTDTQVDFITHMAGDKGCPLGVKILLEDAISWRADSSPHQTRSPLSIEDFVSRRMESMEREFGSVVISAISRYLLAANHGLSEMEMLDLLSCNNDVMPWVITVNNQTIIRFPYILWCQIKRRFGTLLEKRYLDNKVLLTWSHQSVSAAANMCYFVKTDLIKQTHRDIGELFLETWLDNKPMVIPQQDIKIIDNGYRYIAPQPLLYSETKYNFRRLSELWYQCLRTGELDRFKEECWCNFEFLLAKLHATSIHRLLDDLYATFVHALDAELHLLLRTISRAAHTLHTDPLLLACELIGRLRQVKDFYPRALDPLVQQCMEWCDSYHLPIIVPLSSWLPDPRTPLITCINSPETITKVCPTQNTQHVFCATKTYDIRMYHVASRKLIRVLTGHRDKITCLRVTHDNKTLLSGCEDGSVWIWDVSTGRNLQIHREHSSAVTCLALTRYNDLMITGSQDCLIKVMYFLTGEVLHSYRAHESSINCMCLNSTGSILITGSSDCTVKTWYLEDVSLLTTIESGICCPVISMVLSNDNTFLILGCDDGSLHVKSFTTGTDIHKLEGHIGQVINVAVCDDSFHCAVASNEGRVYIYNLCTQELLDQFDTHQDILTDMRLSTDETFIITAAKNQVHVWNMYKRHTRDIHTDEHTDDVTCIDISEDGKTAITGGHDNCVKLWNLEISDLAVSLDGHKAPVTCVALSSDDSFALSGSEDTTVKAWSIVMGCVITDYTEHQTTITAVYIFSDNLKILSAEESGTMKLWNAEDGSTFTCVVGASFLHQISPNRLLGVSEAAEETSVKIWNVENCQVVATVNHKKIITCAIFSPDSQYVATSSLDLSVKVWEANTGKLTQVLVEHEDMITCIAISENNSHLVSGSHDKRLLVWGLSTGAVEHQLIGHTDAVTCVKLTSDGTTAISGSRDGTLRVWHVHHGLLITQYHIHVVVRDLRITSDASRIVVKLEHSSKVPLMCLHNSPAGEVKSQSQIDIEVQGDQPVLPIRPHPMTTPQAYRLISSGPSQNRCPSISTIPEIIKLSPMKAPLQTTIIAQKQKKEIRENSRIAKELSSSGVLHAPRKEISNKKSNVCVIL